MEMLENDLRFDSPDTGGEKEVPGEENITWYVGHYNGQYVP